MQHIYDFFYLVIDFKFNNGVCPPNYWLGLFWNKSASYLNSRYDLPPFWTTSINSPIYIYMYLKKIIDKLYASEFYVMYIASLKNYLTNQMKKKKQDVCNH